ncbi:MAG: hypothetical protein LBT05_16130 [Planctomycetaceae bacterium]|jgi:hypothetical protein|nr:hypothetical protein [Planctomycetaceae bacterium]
MPQETNQQDKMRTPQNSYSEIKLQWTRRDAFLDVAIALLYVVAVAIGFLWNALWGYFYYVFCFQ